MIKSILSIAVCLAVLPAAGAPRRDAAPNPLGNLPARISVPDSRLKAPGDDPILSVEGETHNYISHVYWIHEGVSYFDEGIITHLCESPGGRTVYLGSLMPAVQEGWLEGSSMDDGLHFPSGQLVSKWGIGDIYVSAAVEDRRTGELKTIDEFVLAFDEEGSFTLSDYEGSRVYIIAHLADGMVLECDYKLTLTPFPYSEVTPPEEAEVSDWVRIYFDGVSKFPYEDVVKMATLDGEMWLQGFSGRAVDGYVKADVLPDGSVFIPTGQYIGLSGAYANFLYTATLDADNDRLLPTEGLTLESVSDYYLGGETGYLQFGYSSAKIEYSLHNFILEPAGTQGVGTVDAGHGEAVAVEYRDMLGRRLAAPCGGICIRITTYADGTRRSVKTIH